MLYVDWTVLGGLPVTIAVTSRYGEREEWWITHIGGRAVKKAPDWLYKRMKDSGDEAAINELSHEWVREAA